MDINYYKKYEPIDGKWYINRKLGSGAFGTVLEVERRDQTNMKAAMKIISVPSTPDEADSYRAENYDLDEQSVSSYFYGFVEEFTKEIQLMSELRGHRNVVTIEDYDVKKHTDSIGWDIFIRMELLIPMNTHFAKNSPKTRDVIKLGIDICKALEVCHKFNIVHRDIKPSNIFISKNGDYKLGDFGVARTLEKTVSGSQKGTYTYMAPEIHKGELYNSNVDIYSLGIVMYRLLNNNLEPYSQGRSHTDAVKALDARLKGEPMPAPANAQGRLAEIILKACSFNPKDRYESPLQMRSELESILYTEDEEKIIYPGGEELDFEPSTGRNTAKTDTTGSIDKANEEDKDKTVGLFDTAVSEVKEKDEDKTVGLFDNGNTAAKVETMGASSVSTVTADPVHKSKSVTDADKAADKTNGNNISHTTTVNSDVAFKKLDDQDEELKKIQLTGNYKKTQRIPWIFVSTGLVALSLGQVWIALALAMGGCVQYFIVTERLYRKATLKINRGNPVEAYEIFYSLGNYRDSAYMSRLAQSKMTKKRK